MAKKPHRSSSDQRQAPRDAERGRSPLSPGFDKKLDGPDRPST